MSDRRVTDCQERESLTGSQIRGLWLYCRKNLLRSAMAIEYEIESKNVDLDLWALSVTMSERRVTNMSRERESLTGSQSQIRGLWLYCRKNLLLRLDQERMSTKCMEGVRTRHSTIGQTALCLHLPSLPTAASLCVDVTCRPTVPAGPIMSSPYWRLPSLTSSLPCRRWA